MLKKFLSAVMVLSLVAESSCCSSSASLPPPGKNFFIVFDNLQGKSNIRILDQIQLAQNFINRYRDEVDRPMDTLIRRITREHTLNFVNNSGLYHAVALRDNTPLTNFTERFNRFHRDLVAPLASYILQLIPELKDFSLYPYNPHERLNHLLSLLSDRASDLENIIRQLNNFTTQLSQIEPRRPTPDDLIGGKCTDTHLTD